MATPRLGVDDQVVCARFADELVELVAVVVLHCCSVNGSVLSRDSEGQLAKRVSKTFAEEGVRHRAPVFKFHSLADDPRTTHRPMSRRAADTRTGCPTAQLLKKCGMNCSMSLSFHRPKVPLPLRFIYKGIGPKNELRHELILADAGDAHHFPVPAVQLAARGPGLIEGNWRCRVDDAEDCLCFEVHEGVDSWLPVDHEGKGVAPAQHVAHGVEAHVVDGFAHVLQKSRRAGLFNLGENGDRPRGDCRY